MNDDQLENAIRAELAADAARTPAAGATKLAVHAAVAELPAVNGPHGARRWLLPVAAAAVLVALAVAGFLVPKALTSHPARPSTPLPSQPALPPAPAVKLDCPSGQRTVDGLSAAFTSTAGASRLAYEYYCAGADGSRGPSEVDLYHQASDRLVPITEESAGLFGGYLMSMSGTTTGLKLRLFHTMRAAPDEPSGLVSDIVEQVGATAADPVITTIAQPCTEQDLVVDTQLVQTPIPHRVVTVTNVGKSVCSIWGIPRYRVVGSVPASVRYAVDGPAGGATGQASSPVLLVQPGRSVSSSVGHDQVANMPCRVIAGATATLANGVSLGQLDLGACDNIVGYPFVDSADGSLAVATPAGCDSVGFILTHARLRRQDHAGDLEVWKNNGSVACTIGGYPSAQLEDAQGTVIEVIAQTPRGSLGGLAAGDGSPSQLTLQPGDSMSTIVEWSTGGTGCVHADSIRLGLPSTGVGISDLGATQCGVQIHPFVAGTTGTG